jgi:hypothetical protein
MNKSELEIAKKISEIEGVYDTICGAIEGQQARYDSFMTNGTNAISTPNVQSFESIYNPFDWSILGSLIKKYEVSIQHTIAYVFITQGWKDIEVSFDEDSGITLEHAILECIIKSQEA